MGGVRAAEVARIKVVQQVEPGQGVDPVSGGKVKPATRPGPRPAATLLQLEDKLAYVYRRATLRVHGNVVWATHGEARDEVLGTGDASRPWQSFTLRQGPVTRLPVHPGRVGEHPGGPGGPGPVEGGGRLREAGPADRVYVATTDDAGRTTVTFGDGRFGARPPSGAENVRAHFRVGTGTAGNVQAGQIILLTQPPPGPRASPTRWPPTAGPTRRGPTGPAGTPRSAPSPWAGSSPSGTTPPSPARSPGSGKPRPSCSRPPTAG